MESWNEEAKNRLILFMHECGIEAVHENLADMAMGRYVAYKIKWAIEDILLIFLEICVLIVVWEMEMNVRASLMFRFAIMFGIHAFFTYPRALKDYKQGVETAKMMSQLFERHPKYYRFKEDASDGGSEK